MWDSCLAVWSHHRVSDILLKRTQWAVKVKKWCAEPKTKTKVKSITKTKRNKNQSTKKKQNYKQKTLLFWGAWHESHKNFGQRVELFRTIFRWGGKDVSQIAPYMGTSDDKGSNWAWEFVFARSFFCCCCFVQRTVQVQLRLQVHIEVARGRSFGGSVGSVRPGRSLARFVGLSVVVNNKMFCFNHIVASSYAYALAEGEGDRRAWDSFNISFTFALPSTFSFNFNIVSCCSFFSTPLVVVVVVFFIGGVCKIFFIVGSACYCCCFRLVDGVMMWKKELPKGPEATKHLSSLLVA